MKLTDWRGDEYETGTRVRLQPSGRGSRGFHRDDADWDSATRQYTPKTPKAVTLLVTENITVIMESGEPGATAANAA